VRWRESVQAVSPCRARKSRGKSDDINILRGLWPLPLHPPRQGNQGDA
jgi:hypothetical protein